MNLLLGVLRAAGLKLKHVHRILFSDKYLLVTNIGISVTVSAIGDTIEQQWQIQKKREKEWNGKRCFTMSVAGLFQGSFLHYWYRYLDNRIKGHKIRAVLRKVLIDTVVCSPIQIIIFFSAIALLEGQTLEMFKNELIEKGTYVYALEWVFWAPAQLVNFYFLSPRYRVLYDNICSLFHDIYLSYVKYDKFEK